MQIDQTIFVSAAEFGRSRAESDQRVGSEVYSGDIHSPEASFQQFCLEKYREYGSQADVLIRVLNAYERGYNRFANLVGRATIHRKYVKLDVSVFFPSATQEEVNAIDAALCADATSKSPRSKPGDYLDARGKWGLIGIVAFGIGIPICVYPLQMMLDGYATRNMILLSGLWSTNSLPNSLHGVLYSISYRSAASEVEDALPWFVLIGLLLPGLGQLVQMTIQGSQSFTAIAVDNWCRAISLLGWSLGLTATLYYAVKGGNSSGSIFEVVVIAVGVAMSVCMVLVCSSSRKRINKAAERIV